MRLHTWVISAVALGVIAGCGGSSSSSNSKNGRTNPNPISKLPFRAFVANNFQKVLHIVDETKDQLYTFTSSSFVTPIAGNIPITEATVGVSAGPVALAAAGTGITIVVTQDATGNGLSFIDNAQESQKSAAALPGAVSSVVGTPDGKTAYAAVPTSDAVYAVNIADGSLAATIGVPNGQRLVMSPDGSKVLAFSRNRNFFTIIKTADNTTQQVTGFDAMLYGVISSDNSKAYVLNCGPQCSGTTPASVSVVDLTAAAPALGSSVTVAGATVGTIDSSGNLYVAGSPASGALQGVLSVVSTAGPTISKTAQIGDGLHTIMVQHPNGKIYIGAQNCSNQPAIANSGCLSVYTPSANTATVDQARGNVTGIQPVNAKGRNVTYVTVGGQFLIYDGTTDQPQTNQIPLTGQITDVRSAQ